MAIREQPIMVLLIEFLLRLCLGMAAGMAIVSHRDVSSGYFRNHLYVVLGLATLAALLATSAAPDTLWWSVAVAIVSYAGAICWLYEKPLAGKSALWLAAILATVALVAASSEARIGFLPVIQPVTSALLIGTVMAAMLLGHWYLNAPGMKIQPLQGLLKAILAIATLHAAVCALGLFKELQLPDGLPASWMFVVLRWVCLLGIVGLVYMTWQTLKIPNTQSATGILYVAVIAVFTGEIASLVLSAESTYPI